MREILFRGKTCSGEWIYGLLARKNGKWYIINNKASMPFVCEVIPGTVECSTGLTDKNGRKIFEGDIVNFKTIAYTFKKCVVKYDEQYARFTCIDFNKAGFPMDISFAYEIIGNAHDNPELLEVTK